ncbi:MAG: hypothetical protein LBU43_11125 [Candidatus Accumulibacter sp.]|nr:hypothetical protein [Accumulibacter sp.]
MAVFLIALFPILDTALANETDGASAFTLRGFGTLGVARSTNGQAEITHDLLQPHGVSNHWSGKIDSNLGAQLNYVASDTVEAVAQVVSRYNYKGNFTPQVTELLVNYDPNANLKLIAGRISANLFLRDGNRLIGYSQLAVRPNIDYLSGMAITYLDGVDGRITLPLGKGLLIGEAYYGFLAERYALANGNLDLHGSRTIGVQIDYLSGDWQWHAGISQVRFNHSMPAQIREFQADMRRAGIDSLTRAAKKLDLRDTDAMYYTVGMNYDPGPLLLQLMLSRLNYDTRALHGRDTALFRASYRIGEVKPFIGYSWAKSRRAHITSGLPSGDGWDDHLRMVLAQSYVDQHTVSMGMRWDFQRNMALKFQADLIRGRSNSIYAVRDATPRWDGKTKLFSVALDFAF